MKMHFIISCLAACAVLAGCHSQAGGGKDEAATAGDTAARVEFNADTAYAYVARQCQFGPRVPLTPAHKACGAWIEGQLRRFCDQVVAQPAPVTTFDGHKLDATNYVGIINPKAQQRLLLVAHWDCRPWADNDPDPAKRREPVMGANDAASGVAVLLETARQLHARKPAIGVDILLVDAEDWGTENNDSSWALGTQYWCKHPHVAGYQPIYGILLDMVGASGATFKQEYFSMQYGSDIVANLWQRARDEGFGSYFVTQDGGGVTDDHVSLNQAGIRCIDVIDLRSGEDSGGFFPYWHTTGDTLDKISRETLKAVGQTLLSHIMSIEAM